MTPNATHRIRQTDNARLVTGANQPVAVRRPREGGRGSGHATHRLLTKRPSAGRVPIGERSCPSPFTVDHVGPEVSAKSLRAVPATTSHAEFERHPHVRHRAACRRPSAIGADERSCAERLSPSRSPMLESVAVYRGADAGFCQ
jgi:hypothetical protein